MSLKMAPLEQKRLRQACKEGLMSSEYLGLPDRRSREGARSSARPKPAELRDYHEKVSQLLMRWTISPPTSWREQDVCTPTPDTTATQADKGHQKDSEKSCQQKEGRSARKRPDRHWGNHWESRSYGSNDLSPSASIVSKSLVKFEGLAAAHVRACLELHESVIDCRGFESEDNPGTFDVAFPDRRRRRSRRT